MILQDARERGAGQDRQHDRLPGDSGEVALSIRFGPIDRDLIHKRRLLRNQSGRRDREACRKQGWKGGEVVVVDVCIRKGNEIFMAATVVPGEWNNGRAAGDQGIENALEVD